ncbi:MAG: DUF655 domain-containing protein, partial [Candidatus ainarchaeum sp.]|nr:DUF655 domain-containing protein [Candidatus ainarchaeum sp.]
VIGTKSFTLLEVVPKEGLALKVGEQVYVGKETRDKIEYIKSRVNYKDLTNNAISELEKTIEKLVLDDKQRFLDFFNASGSITIKRHQLELLPGLGKKHMLDILAERQKKPFESFEDLEQRVHLMPNPAKTIAKRIIEELENPDEKHFLFCRPPVVQKPQFSRFGRQNFSRP